MALKTDYKSAEYIGLRKYRQVTNDDGTVSFIDVTDYAVVGSEFGGADINATNQAVNEVNEGLALKASTDTATTATAGLMSAADKAKLNGIQAGAQTRIGNPVYISATAPTDTTGLWVVPPT